MAVTSKIKAVRRPLGWDKAESYFLSFFGFFAGSAGASSFSTAG